MLPVARALAVMLSLRVLTANRGWATVARSGSPPKEFIPGGEHSVRTVPGQCQTGHDWYGAMPVLWSLLQHQRGFRAWHAGALQRRILEQWQPLNAQCAIAATSAEQVFKMLLTLLRK